MLGLFARKVGMTQVFDDAGNLLPVTVMRFDPNVVIAKKTKEADGYESVIVGINEEKKNRITKSRAGQFPKDISPKKRIRELRDFEKDVAVGDALE